MTRPRFYTFGWIPVAALLYAVLYAYPSNLGTVLYWSFIVQLIGYYTIGAGLKSPAYLAGQAQALSKQLVFDSVHFLCGVVPPNNAQESSTLWFDSQYRKKLLWMCDVIDRVSRYVTEAINWISSLMGAIALFVVVMSVFELSVGDSEFSMDLFQSLFVLLVCLVNYAWTIMVRSVMLCAMTHQAQLLRANIHELERLHDFRVAVSAMPAANEELPRVVTNRWDKITGERERKYRAVEVLRRLLEHNCRVRIRDLLEILENANHFSQFHDALGGGQLRKLLRNCQEHWTIGDLTPSGEPWRFCSQAALSSGDLEPVVWG